MPTTVVNIHHRTPFDVYIGRAGKGQSGEFGNDHVVGKPCPLCPGVTHQRGEAVKAFRTDFLKRVEKDPDYRQRVLTMKGKILACFCKPAACHGDVYVEWLESQL